MMTVSDLQANIWLEFNISLSHSWPYSVPILGMNPATYSVAEDAGSVDVTLSLLSGTLTRGFSVVLETSDSFNDGTATGGIVFVAFMFSTVLKCNTLQPFVTLVTLDYGFTRRELTFNPTTSSQVVTIAILEDIILESSETISVTLKSLDPAAILNPASAVITIEDNDGKLLSCTCIFLNYGDTARYLHHPMAD